MTSGYNLDPLTPAEEAGLRANEDTRYGYWLKRLLATLDAERDARQQSVQMGWLIKLCADPSCGLNHYHVVAGSGEAK